MNDNPEDRMTEETTQSEQAATGQRNVVSTLERIRDQLRTYASTVDEAARQPDRRERQLGDGMATPLWALDQLIFEMHRGGHRDHADR